MDILQKKKFIINKSGKPTDVILDIKTYEKVIEELDELYCIREYDKAKKTTDSEINKGEYVTLDDYIKKRLKESKGGHKRSRRKRTIG